MTPRPPQNQRSLPAVERVLKRAEVVQLSAERGRTVVTRWIRQILDDMRSGSVGELPEDPSAVIDDVVRRLVGVARREASVRLRRVINGTGIVIHTNLGRAPLATAAVQAMIEAASCTNLEVDLTS